MELLLMTMGGATLLAALWKAQQKVKDDDGDVAAAYYDATAPGGTDTSIPSMTPDEARARGLIPAVVTPRNATKTPGGRVIGPRPDVPQTMGQQAVALLAQRAAAERAAAAKGLHTLTATSVTAPAPKVTPSSTGEAGMSDALFLAMKSAKRRQKIAVMQQAAEEEAIQAARAGREQQARDALARQQQQRTEGTPGTAVSLVFLDFLMKKGYIESPTYYAAQTNAQLYAQLAARYRNCPASGDCTPWTPPTAQAVSGLRWR